MISSQVAFSLHWLTNLCYNFDMRISLDSISNQLVKSWWVVLFTLFCYGVYERGSLNLSHDYSTLSTQLNRLQHERRKALAEQAEFKRQINSQSDPAWVELILMRELGLSPEGHTKVYFY